MRGQWRSFLEGNHTAPNVEKVVPIQASVGPSKKKGQSVRGRAFTEDEDRLIYSAWLNINKDPITGTGQSAEGYYKLLHKYFEENYGGQSNRTYASIQNRWQTIQKVVNKFCGFYSQVERRNPSGYNEQDMINEAIKMYEQNERWHFRHCWKILKNEPKWNNRLLDTSRDATNKNRQGTYEDSATNSVQGETSCPARPEGRDSANKRRAKLDSSSSTSAVEMLQKMHDRDQQMDEQDLKHKERLMSMEEQKIELQKKQFLAKMKIKKEANQLKRKEALNAKRQADM